MSRSPRSSRYSGRDRPAWRMNHTGVRSTGWRRRARSSRSLGGGHAAQDTERGGARASPYASSPGTACGRGAGSRPGSANDGRRLATAAPDRVHQPVDVERLRDVARRAERLGARDVLRVLLARAHDHGRGVAERVELLEHLPPVDPREHHVEDHGVGSLALDPLDRGACRRPRGSPPSPRRSCSRGARPAGPDRPRRSARAAVRARSRRRLPATQDEQLGDAAALLLEQPGVRDRGRGLLGEHRQAPAGRTR